MTLTEFLLARIAEDKKAAQVGVDAERAWPRYANAVAGEHYGAGWLVMQMHPARVLAECEAKRRIVEDEHFDGRSGNYIGPWCSTCSDDESLVYLPCPTLRHLAAVYADHPDYRDEWKL